MMPTVPLPVRLYGAASRVIAPLAYRRVAAKLGAQGIPKTRLKERLGHATAERPQGRLMWFHAASVGESVSVLRLITRLSQIHGDMSFLITSGTATSAQIVAKRLPPRSIHQFAPLDTKPALRRFLAHWHPDVGVFVESEIWPHMLMQSRAHGVPLALINARISDRSARNWKLFAASARFLLDHFGTIHCQDNRTEANLRILGLSKAEKGPNLKALSDALPVDKMELKAIRSQVGDRPLWLASSTHPGEDEIVINAHRHIVKQNPDALLILVPRHTERAGDIARIIDDAKLTHARRNKGGTIAPDIQVYLADTLGETGLWYALCPLTCLCGSFSPVGGHNPFEPAHAGSAILHGPLYPNFTEAYTDLDTIGAALEVRADALTPTVTKLLSDPEQLEDMRKKARAFATGQEDVLDTFAMTLSNALSLR